MQDVSKLEQMRIVYTLPGMEQVPVKKDIVYKSVEGEDLAMDVYYPANMPPDILLPAVIFVHGGSRPEMVEHIRENQQYVSWSQLTAASGLIAVMFKHRADEGYSKLYNAGDDVADLLAYIRTHGASLGVNADALAIWSCSGGSLYGLSAALQGTPAYIRCAVAYYGGITLMDSKLFHFSAEEEAGAREFSPLYHLSREDPAEVAPLFIAKAGSDSRASLNELLYKFVSMANERNVPLTFMNHPMGEHGFDIMNDDARTYEIIKATVAFMHEHLYAAMSS